MIDFIFAVFSFIALFFALCVVSSKDPVHSVLSLMAVFVSVAALFLLLKAEFVAMALILLYLGAVVVLFLFVVMMITPEQRVIGGRYYRLYSFLALSSLLALSGVFLVAMIGGSEKLISSKMSANFSLDALALGREIFSIFNLEFIFLSMILLTAVLGAVVLTGKDLNIGKKRQDVAIQLGRKSSVKLVDVEIGGGVNW